MPVIDGKEMTIYPGGGMKHTGGKLRLSLVPIEGIRAVAQVMQTALSKYKAGSWRYVPPEMYKDAAFRHLLKCIEDPLGKDEESGLPHSAHLAACGLILAALEKDLMDKDKSDKEENNVSV